jgi:hypothetical protein
MSLSLLYYVRKGAELLLTKKNMTQIILSLLLAVSSMLVQMQTTPNISEVQRQQVLGTALQVLTVAQNYENSLPAATSTDDTATTTAIVVPDLTIVPTVTTQTQQYQQNQPDQNYNPALGQTYTVIPDPSCTITGTLMPNPNGATDKALFDWDVENGSPITLNALTVSDGRSSLFLYCGTNCKTTITAPTTHGIGQWDQTYAQVTASTTTFTLNVTGNGKTASCSTTVLDPNGY